MTKWWDGSSGPTRDETKWNFKVMVVVDGMEKVYIETQGIQEARHWMEQSTFGSGYDRSWIVDLDTGLKLKGNDPG